MTSWADRAKTHFSQKRQVPTAETAKSMVSAVLAVPFGAVYENSKVLSAVLAVPTRHISEKHAFSELAANDTTVAEPKRLFRPRGPWLSPLEQVAADKYHQHHATCPQCQAAGRGYTRHCGAGAELWAQYQGAAV